jgi:hypothetical protein
MTRRELELETERWYDDESRVMTRPPGDVSKVNKLRDRPLIIKGRGEVKEITDLECGDLSPL